MFMLSLEYFWLTPSTTMTYILYLFGWVAVQYHGILNECVVFGRACRTSQIQARRVQCPVILDTIDSYPFIEKLSVYIVHDTHDSKWPVHLAVQYHCMDIGWFAISEYYIVVI